MPKYHFWFLAGSQHLYGPEVLKEVAAHASTMAEGFNADKSIPYEVISKGVATTPDEIKDICVAANSDNTCAGVITWMHTFSPGKMWIGGLTILNKPYLHLNTQFNRNIPLFGSTSRRVGYNRDQTTREGFGTNYCFDFHFCRMNIQITLTEQFSKTVFII